MYILIFNFWRKKNILLIKKMVNFWRTMCISGRFYITHSMVQSPSWAANWFAASQEIPRISRNPKALLYFIITRNFKCGPVSSVGIATELRAGRSGIKSRWGRDFPPVKTGPGVHPASCKMGTRSFPGVKCGRVVLLNTHPFLVPRS
jgi:hypothetical protein